jgi:hypothetical protein
VVVEGPGVPGSDSEGRRCDGNVVGMVAVSRVVGDVVPDVVSVGVVVAVVVPEPDGLTSVGSPMSVVDSGTLVVKVIDVSDGVMMNGCRSCVVVGAGGVAVVVSTVVVGLLHSSDI